MQQPHQHTDQLTVLSSLARIATATLDVDQMLIAITEQVRQGFGHHHVELYLLDEETSELVLRAQSGSDPPAAPGRRQPITLGIMGRTVRTRQPQLVHNVQADPDYCTGFATTRTELCVPIVAAGHVLGLLNLESADAEAFNDEDVAVLATATDILASAMENARLSRRAQEAAVLEERNRLARELHDSVTQQLFSMTLTAQAARAHLEKNPQRAAAQLERLQETAIAALAEMRALIAQLRPPALADEGLVNAMRQYVATLSKREYLRIELRVSGNERLSHGFELALYRILQEALNNVVKHAHASNVRVTLEFDTRQVSMRITDDGQGFDVYATTAGSDRHLGLVSMRERAAEIGGTLALTSTIGGGTDIVVNVPRT
jgi:signal transduction histidine kinase